VSITGQIDQAVLKKPKEPVAKIALEAKFDDFEWLERDEI
jgi:hypothetical protein